MLSPEDDDDDGQELREQAKRQASYRQSAADTRSVLARIREVMGPKGMDCVWWITNAGPFMLGRGMNNTDEDWDVNYMCRLPTLRKHGYGGSSSSLPSANNPPPPPPRYWECAPGRAACTREQMGEISRKVCHHHVGCVGACVGCEHYTVPRERHVARAGAALSGSPYAGSSTTQRPLLPPCLPACRVCGAPQVGGLQKPNPRCPPRAAGGAGGGGMGQLIELLRRVFPSNTHHDYGGGHLSTQRPAHALPLLIDWQPVFALQPPRGCAIE
eukprot:COSAG01_NODE_16638_length_1218_cov_4.399464_2_plen_271_part_00